MSLSRSKSTCRSCEESQEFYIQPDDLSRRLSAARAPPTSHPMLHTLEETLDASISTTKTPKWLEAGYQARQDARRPVDQKAGGLRRSSRSVLRRSITWGIDSILCCMCPDRLPVQGGRVYLSLQWRRLEPYDNRDAMYLGTNAFLFWIETCSPKQPQSDLTADRVMC